MKNLISLSLALIFCFNLYASVVTEEAFFVFDTKGVLKKRIQSMPYLTMDHPNSHGFELYGPRGLGEWLQQQDYEYIELNNGASLNAVDYPTPEDINKALLKLVKKHPHIAKAIKLGESHKGRPLYMIKISDNVKVDEIEPEVKYVANMHGDEIVGRELMVRLIDHLLSNYQSSLDIKQLIDNTEIYIMASMNPDGAARSTRGNEHYVDLNRDFPDFTTRDNDNSTDGREPETKALMEFQNQRHFALSANFHGGAVVMNYPWDTTNKKFPAEDYIIKRSLDYAELVPDMRDSTRFPRGIVNGHDWYEVNGGMQDWSYYWYGDMQVTIELTQRKWPSYSTIQKHWNDHKQSLINYLKAVHLGGGITLKDRTDLGIVKIWKQGTLLGTFPYHAGEMYFALPKGEYKFSINSENSEVRDVEVTIDHSFKENGNYIKIN